MKKEKEKKTFVREKRTVCGNYVEVDIYPYSDEQKLACRKKRRRRMNVSPPKQRNLNEKNARRYFLMLANGNFSEDDIIIHLTYDDAFLPKSDEEAQKHLERFLGRVRKEMKKNGKQLKYLQVTERGRLAERYHHHVILNGDIGRDKLEALWYNASTKPSERVPLGYANARKVQPGKAGIMPLALYLAKGRKRYTCSKNLIRPYEITNDSKYSFKKLHEIGNKGPAELRAYAEKQYKNYDNISSDVLDVVDDLEYAVQYNNILSAPHINFKFFRRI